MREVLGAGRADLAGDRDEVRHRSADMQAGELGELQGAEGGGDPRAREAGRPGNRRGSRPEKEMAWEKGGGRTSGSAPVAAAP
jgi:hypothetical protein